MLEYEVRLKNRLWRMKENAKESIREFFTTEDGDTNFISIIIVLVIVIALAAMFRNNIKAIVNSMWTSIAGDLGEAGVNGVDSNISASPGNLEGFE